MLEAGMRDLDELLNLPRNPKLHALQEIGNSMGRWGFVHRVIINVNTSHIVAGNGRIEKLKGLRELGKVPENVTVKDGAWLIPVDLIDIPESEELPLAIALNNLEEKGGWDDELLAVILQEILDAEGEAGLIGVSFTDEDIALLTAKTFEESPDEFPEYDESIANQVEFITCPKCGHSFPK